MVERVEQPAISARGRWMIAVGLTVLVFVAVPVTLVAWANPWRYVYLMPFGRSATVVTVLVAAPVLLGIAVLPLLRNKFAMRVVGIVAGVVALAVCGFGLEFWAAASVFGAEPNRTEIVAVSPDRKFELVVLRYPVFMTDLDIVRIRSRAGLRSREANQDLACFARPFDPVGPEDRFASARFLDNQRVEVRTRAGPPWTTTFDRRTLLAEATLDHGCRT